MSIVKLNNIPSITWHSLDMNNAVLEDLSFEEAEVAEIIKPDDVKTGFQAVASVIPTGAGNEFSKTLKGSVVAAFTAVKETKEPIRINYNYSDGVSTADRVQLYAKEDSSVTLIQVFRGERGAKGRSAVQTKLCLEKNSKVHLIQIQLFEEGYDFINDIGAEVYEGAEFKLTNIFMGSSRNYFGVRVELEGEEASFIQDTGYKMTEKGSLDINIIANHIGKRTVSEINAEGVLCNEAEKIFRGTIDFKKGAAESVGAEKEDVLLMDEGVRNKTIPVILCHEEDVEGSHGATIGKLEDEILFYMESRGIEAENIYKLMSDARIKAVADLIPDETARKLVYDYIGVEADD